MPKTAWAIAIAALLPGGFLCANGEATSPGSTPLMAEVPWTVNKLPQRSVVAITQTRDGYLWLGTLNGLVRFDGTRYTWFQTFNTPGLPNNRIVFLFADSHDNLWVGTETAGAVVIKNGKVTPLDLGTRGREGRLVSATEDKRGAVWLCTANGRLCRYLDGDVSVWQLGNPAAVGEFRALAVEATGTLWVGADHLLAQLDTAKVVAGQGLPPHPEIYLAKLDYLLTSTSGGFWLLANGRVQLYQTNRIVKDFGPYPWTNAPVLAACEDRDGNLVVGTQNRGLTWFDANGRAKTLTSGSAQGLTHNTVLSLLMDREGSMWVGTDSGGLNRVKRQIFQVLPEPRPSVMLSVCEDTHGGLWLASTDLELKYFRDGKFRGYGREEGLGGEGTLDLNLRSVFVDRNQRVWVGTLGYGLFRLEGDKFRPAPKSEIVPREISALHQDRTGKLWVGTQGGLARWDGENWKLFTGTNELAGDKVAAIADDSAGNLWVGTDRGLTQMRDGRVVTNCLPGEDVSALLSDAEGVLWVGTRGNGMARFANRNWTHYSTDNGLADNGINYLIEDGQGYLWLGSFAGLMRVSKDDLKQVAEKQIASVRCRAYGSADGLPTEECSSGSQPAACRTRDGKMWFPTIRGLVSVDPAQLMRNTNPPPVMIEAILVDDKLQNTNRLRSNWPNSLTIPAGKERLEIRYTSLNLLAPDRARFKYQLEGHESEVDAGDTRVARYSNLSPGRYTFRVTACNEDGEWNKVGASLAIVVEPPFWREWWFLTLAAVCLLGLIVGTVHFISTQKLQRQLATLRQMEALEKERARIARDLHDQLGANLTQVSLLGEMVEADKELPAEVEAHARQISKTARTTALALDEIVWAANPANDTLESLVTYACKYAQEYFALAGLSHRLEVPEHLPATTIPPDVRHNVFLAFKEAVNNVVKHAQASAVKVKLILEAGRFTFEIEDDGRGLPAGAENKGRNGLRNMRKRMEDVGGEFSAGPAPERGTRVCLTAPIRRN